MASELGYRPCVGIMLLNRDNLVWVGRRVDRDKGRAARNEHYKGGDWWQMPQGGIERDEVPEVAAKRELFEETGVAAERAEVLGQTAGWLNYDLPDNLIGKVWGGKYRGQTQLWFAMRFLGEDGEIDIGPSGGADAEFDAWRWLDVVDLPKVVVPFKREIYGAVAGEFERHFLS